MCVCVFLEGATFGVGGAGSPPFGAGALAAWEPPRVCVCVGVSVCRWHHVCGAQQVVLVGESIQEVRHGSVDFPRWTHQTRSHSRMN